MEKKLRRLKDSLGELERVLIAFSGGVDSTFLARVAGEVLGEGALTVTAVSPTYPDGELEAARGLARELGIRHEVIETRELSDPRFAGNPPKRCYFCKLELFSRLKEIAAREGVPWILDGSNRDDSRDIRPGERAARELGVRSPLRESGFTKDEIRRAARELGLSNWDKPALACLASRIPYGQRINPEILEMIARAESEIRGLGFGQVRVRHHGRTARIEVSPGEMERLMKPEIRDVLIRKLKGLGYNFIALDLEGYRTGSLNEGVKKQESWKAGKLDG